MNNWLAIGYLCNTVALLTLWLSMRSAEQRIERLENGNIKKQV